MVDPDSRLRALVAMSRELGDPANDYVILGEGNTSAAIDEHSFFVKASGAQLPGIDESGFVRVARQPVRWMMHSDTLTDEEIREGLANACLGETTLRPSVETFLHAVLLELEGVEFVAHTHPTPVNTLLCSKLCARQPHLAVQGRLFPDEVVCCGPESPYIPYTDPGLPLARAVEAAAEQFLREYEVPPRVIMMQNHGMIATGGTPAEVLNTTAMAVKAARIRVAAHAFGGLRPLTQAELERIFTRADEKYREDLLRGD